MRQGFGIWLGATALSLIGHAGAGAVLLWVLEPDDVPSQPTPETQMQLAAFQVPRSEAQVTEPEGDTLAPGDVDGARVGQGAIPTSRAEASAPPVDATPSLDTTGGVSEAQAVSGESITAVDAVPDAMASLAMSPEAAKAVQAENASVPQQSIDSSVAESIAGPSQDVAAATPLSASSSQTDLSQTAVASVEPYAEEAVAVLGQNQVVATLGLSSTSISLEAQLRSQSAVLVSATVATAAPSPVLSPDAPSAIAAALPIAPAAEPSLDPVVSTAVAPPTQKGTAQLAFPNAGDGPVDPVSLAAFQSFMSPGDLGGAAAEVRDSISSTLSAIPCARLQARFDPDENILIMTGHVPEDGLRQTVLTAMQGQMGADIPVREDLLVLPRPQCGALTGISQVGLPQSTDQITNPLLVGAGTHAREFRYVDGQALVLSLQGADYDAYVYVDFFDAAGNVIHLTPNDFVPLERTLAKSSLQIGSARPLSPGEPGLYIKIGPPYGQEIAVAFAASEPLYEGIRPLVEPADAYLSWLQDRVTDARAENPDFKGEWVYFFISTSAE